MKRLGVVLVIALCALGMPGAHADGGADCVHDGAINVSGSIFPPPACRAHLAPGRYHLQLSWAPPTSGRLLVDIADRSGEQVYFYSIVQAGLVTHYETPSSEASPPPSPLPPGPIAGDLTVHGRGGDLVWTVWPIELGQMGGPMIIPLGSFHLSVTPIA